MNKESHMAPNMLFQCRAIFVVALLAIAGCTEYDVDTPDTSANRAGFARHLKISPSEAVKDVYYYADEFGADFRYQLSFKCDRETIDRIVDSLGLKKGADGYNGLRPRGDLKWWQPDSIDGRSLWIKKGDRHYFELWYSESDSTALYHEYSV